MRAAETPEAAITEGIAIARETVQALAARVQGLQISAPSGRIDAILSLMEQVR
jgi:hypothetical protein